MHDNARLDWVPLSQIRYNPAINARRDTDTDVTELAATIDSKAIGQPLLLRPVGEFFEPVDGGRRFRALDLLVAKGKAPADTKVPALIRTLNDEEALTLSLSTAITRIDLNPADEAASFQALTRNGQRPEDIAAVFGVPVRRVRQRLAIAGLPEPIIAALRHGEIDVAAAQAFTVGTQETDTLKVWKEYSSTGKSWGPSYIVNRLTQKRISAETAEAQFVGVQAYQAAGGTIDEDLFSNNRWLRDGKLLTKLFEAKIKAETQRLTKEGWSFIIEERDPFSRKTANWPVLQPGGKPSLTKEQHAHVAELRAEQKRLTKSGADAERLQQITAEIEELSGPRFTPAQMKTAGVAILWDKARITILHGIMKPAAAAKAKAKESKQKARDTSTDPSPVRKVEDAEADFTSALNAEMAKAMTHAMQRAMARAPGLTMRALAATLLAQRYAWETPLRIEAQPKYMDVFQGLDSSWSAIRAPFEGKTVAQIFEDLGTAGANRVEEIIAIGIARTFAIGGEIKPETAPLIKAFDPAVAEGWEAGEDFFKRLPRESLAAALGDAGVPGVSATKKKKELVEMALRHLPPVGWLPKPLRTPSYKGPGSNAWLDAKAAQAADAPPAAPIEAKAGE